MRYCTRDNATPRLARKTKDWPGRYKWKILQQPSYNPDVAPFFFFFLSGPLKKHFGWTNFQNEEVMDAVIEYFNGKCIAYFHDGIFKSHHGSKKMHKFEWWVRRKIDKCV